MSILERFERAALPPDDAAGRLPDLRRVAVRTVVDSIDDRVPGLAAEMSFFVIVSLPPLLLVVLGSVGFIVGSLPDAEVTALQDEILSVLGTFLSESTVDEVLGTAVERLLEQGRSDILSIGIVLTIWSASRATNVLLRTLTTAYDLEDRRPAWKRRLLALGITVVGILIAVVVLPFLVVGPRLMATVLEVVGLGSSLLRFWGGVYWGGVILIAVVALAWLYQVAPGWHTPWRRDVPGAVLALATWLLASWGLRIYTADIAGFTADDAFAGLAAPLVLLLWVYVSAIAVLLGAELNAEIERLWPTEEGPYDHRHERI